MDNFLVLVTKDGTVQLGPNLTAGDLRNIANFLLQTADNAPVTGPQTDPVVSPELPELPEIGGG